MNIMIYFLLLLLLWENTCSASETSRKRSSTGSLPDNDHGGYRGKLCLTHIKLAKKCRLIDNPNGIVALPKMAVANAINLREKRIFKVAPSMEYFKFGRVEELSHPICIETMLNPGERVPITVGVENEDHSVGSRRL